MRGRDWLLAAWLIVFATFDLQAITNETVESLNQEIRFSPESTLRKPFIQPTKDRVSILGNRFERALTDDERAAFLRKPESIGWKTFEDEVIRFDYPDDKLIVVVPIDRKDSQGPSVAMGGVVTTVDNRYRRAYQISVGKDRLPYATILVTEADWLDQGICFCGPIRAKRYVIRDGNLLEYSLMPSGSLKKIQVLGKKRRAIFFEWTHSALPQATYLRMAHSIRLRDRSDRSEQDWIDFTREKGGEIERFKWIRPGATRNEVVTLIGEPYKEEPDVLTFLSEERPPDKEGYRALTTVTLTDGVLAGLDRIRERSVPLAPPEGTLAWAEFRLLWQGETFEDPIHGNVTYERLSETEVQSVLDLFVEKTRGNPEAELWERCCGVLNQLAGYHPSDDRVAPILVEKWNDRSLPFGLPFLLEEYGIEGHEAMILERARWIVNSKPGPNGRIQFDDEFEGLIRCLGDQHPETGVLLKLAIASPSVELRRVACRFSHYVEPALQRELLLRGLEDSHSGVRSWAAEWFIGVSEHSDLPLLRELLEKEESKDTRSMLELSVDKLTGKRPDLAR